MRILLIHTFYQQYGGEDSVALAERRLLEQNGHSVFFYSRHNDEIKQYNLINKIGLVRDTVYSSRTATEIRGLVREFKPDVAFVHNYLPLISPSVHHTLHTLGVPNFQVLHNFRPFCPNGLFYTNGGICEKCTGGNYLHAIVNRCYRESYVTSALYAASLGLNRLAGLLDKVRGFVCLTEFARQKLIEAGVPESKLFLRPNFIEPPPMRAGAFQGKGDYVLFVGRLAPEKGLWTLVRAFEKVKDTELRILGTGPLEPELRAYVRDRRLHNVTLYGFRGGEEKWDQLRGCRFSVVPSEWYENFPVAVLESYAAGKAVVASNIGSLPHVINHGRTGLLFHPGDADSLAQTINHLLARSSECTRMGEEGRRLVESKYSPSAWHQTLIEMVQAVQAQSAARTLSFAMA